MRFRIFVAFLAVAAVAVFTHIPTGDLHPAAPAAVEPMVSPVHSASVSAVRAAYPTDAVPHRTPYELLGLGAIVGATAKRTRRKEGKTRDVPMIVDSILHVQRKNDDSGKVETVAIPAGVLVDDTELEDDEIDEFIARRVIRPAKPEELAHAEQAETREARAELEATHRKEIDQLRANQEAERVDLEGKEGTSPAALAKLADKHATAMSTLQTKHAEALAKLDAQNQ